MSREVEALPSASPLASHTCAVSSSTWRSWLFVNNTWLWWRNFGVLWSHLSPYPSKKLPNTMRGSMASWYLINAVPLPFLTLIATVIRSHNSEIPTSQWKSKAHVHLTCTPGHTLFVQTRTSTWTKLCLVCTSHYCTCKYCYQSPPCHQEKGVP